MVLERFRNDGIPTIPLNDIQIKYKKLVEEKIKNKHYTFETISCVVCDSKSFETISEKDKHGLLFFVSICKNCGLVQTNPRMMESHYLEFYESEYRKLYSSQTTLDSFFKNQYEQGKNIYNFI